MYFNSETQSKVLSRLFFALNPKGFLFLGKAEMLLTRSHLFRAVDLRHRIFAKTLDLDRTGLRDAVPMSQTNAESENVPTLTEQFFNSSQSAEIIVNPNGTIVLINDKAKSLFGLLSRDVGRLIKDIDIGYRPLDLQRYVMQCSLEKSPVVSEKVTRTLLDGSKQCLRALFCPLMLERSIGTVSGIGIRFEDLTETEKVFADFQNATGRLAEASEELESVREELETTNEELQSSNEELETTNEELQSTNEELETMNEELQSTNTELDTTNQELRQLYDSLNSTHVFLESILASIGSAVIVVDRELKILHWSDRATNLWGLRADEVKGKNIKDLDIGLQVRELVPDLIRIISKDAQFLELVLPATNRRGVHIDCAIKLALCKGTSGEPVGVILLMDEMAKGS
jgi:two-component system CheB/CheR fusion protein